MKIRGWSPDRRRTQATKATSRISYVPATPARSPPTVKGRFRTAALPLKQVSAAGTDGEASVPAEVKEAYATDESSRRRTPAEPSVACHERRTWRRLGFGNCSSERRPPSGGCAGGEILGVTDRGQLVAVLAPPSVTVGTGSLIAAGRVSLARRIQGPLPAPVVHRPPPLLVIPVAHQRGIPCGRPARGQPGRHR